MRVLLTTDTIGGVWTYTKELSEGLLQRSNPVALVSFGRAPSLEQAAWASELTTRYPGDFSYLASNTPLEWMDGNDSAYTGAEALLLELAENLQPDLLHSNQFCFGKLPLAAPRLVVAHSDVLSWAAACRPQGLDSSPWLDRYTTLVRDGLHSANAVAAPTRWMLDALGENFDLPAEAHVIPNGRDLTPPITTELRKLQAVTIGRLWDEAKGISTLAGVQAPFPIFVAGETQHQANTAAPALGRATLLGPLDEAPLFDLLRSSSIYLALSIYEPFGLAPLEAALFGCAVIARDLPSFREVWRDAALYFQDTSTLNSLLKQLASDPTLLARSQRRALERATQLSRAQMTDGYLDLYHHLLQPMHSLFPSHIAAAEVSSRAS